MLSIAIINLINGLFNTNHSLNSVVLYHNTEFISSPLNKRFADVLVSIQGILYHLEAQMTMDKSIVVRVFEYGFQAAMDTRDSSSVLKFPEPIIIYLDTEINVPDSSTLTLDFGVQGTFDFKVRNFIFQNYNVTELNQKKMIILIPFQMLKLRKIIAKEPSEKNFATLQDLILNDIICSIEANLTVGNITSDDASQLKELTLQLYEHIYANYDQLGGYDNMKPLLKGAIELPLDKYRIRIDELEQNEATLKQNEAALEKENQRLRELLKQYENKESSNSSPSNKM